MLIFRPPIGLHVLGHAVCIVVGHAACRNGGFQAEGPQHLFEPDRVHLRAGNKDTDSLVRGFDGNHLNIVSLGKPGRNPGDFRFGVQAEGMGHAGARLCA